MTRDLADTVKGLRERLELARPNRIREAAYILADQFANKGWLKVEPSEYSAPDMICDAFYPVVAELIAQATADALEAAERILVVESRERQHKAEVNDMERDKDSALAHRWDCILLNSLVAKIHALIPKKES
jgi:hypothetical protein